MTIKTKEYPLPVFYYSVDFIDLKTKKSTNVAFSEVSGLSIEYQTITYKDGLSFKEGAKHMPGMGTPVELNMKRGVTKSGKELYDWLQTINLTSVTKKDITVSLMSNDQKTPLVTWTVTGAFPKKLDAPSFNADSNEVAIESLDLMASGLSIKYSK